jgi:hypothetical protein
MAMAVAVAVAAATRVGSYVVIIAVLAYIIALMSAEDAAVDC